MTVESLQTWKDELSSLPKVADNSWGNNFAGWYVDMIANIEPDPTVFVDPNFIFTFPVSAFGASLASLTPTDDPSAGIGGFADAWESALLSTTITVAPGAFLPPASPATTFSSFSPPPPLPVDSTSIASGKAKLLELVSSEPVSDPQDSDFPEKFREATLLLTFTVAGTNSTSPTAPLGPVIVPLI